MKTLQPNTKVTFTQKHAPCAHHVNSSSMITCFLFLVFPFDSFFTLSISVVKFPICSCFSFLLGLLTERVIVVKVVRILYGQKLKLLELYTIKKVNFTVY